MQSPSVNLVLNSNNALSGADTRSLTYFVDWRSILNPNKKYYLHFNFMSGLNTWTGTKFPVIHSNIATNNYQPTGGNTSVSQFMGVIMPVMVQGSATTVYFQSTDATNVPIYVSSPIGNNNLTIQIFDNAAVPVPYLDNAAVPVPMSAYVLVLRFTEVDDSDM